MGNFLNRLFGVSRAPEAARGRKPDFEFTLPSGQYLTVHQVGPGKIHAALHNPLFPGRATVLSEGQPPDLKVPPNVRVSAGRLFLNGAQLYPPQAPAVPKQHTTGFDGRVVASPPNTEPREGHSLPSSFHGWGSKNS